VCRSWWRRGPLTSLGLNLPEHKAAQDSSCESWEPLTAGSVTQQQRQQRLNRNPSSSANIQRQRSAVLQSVTGLGRPGRRNGNGAVEMKTMRRRSSLSYGVMVIDMGVHQLSGLPNKVNLTQVSGPAGARGRGWGGALLRDL